MQQSFDGDAAVGHDEDERGTGGDAIELEHLVAASVFSDGGKLNAMFVGPLLAYGIGVCVRDLHIEHIVHVAAHLGIGSRDIGRNHPALAARVEEVMFCQSAFAFDYYVNGIYYRKATQQVPGGGCGETYLIVVNDDDYSTYSGDVVIPETETINEETYRVRYIGSEAFYACTNLTSVTLSNNIVNIGFHSFAECPLLEVMDLPEGMVQINSNAFSNCPNLDYIFIHNTEPFFLWDDALADINDHVQIVVPCNCIEAFEASEEWQGIQLYDDCGHVGVEESGKVTMGIYPNPASETLTIETEGTVTIYDALGCPVRTLFVNRKETIDLQGLASGIYFVKVGNEVRKIIVE